MRRSARSDLCPSRRWWIPRCGCFPHLPEQKRRQLHDAIAAEGNISAHLEDLVSRHALTPDQAARENA
jgi:hypothetical protein